MSDTCDVCGKPVLATDTACWHCGNPLPRRERRAAPPATPGKMDTQPTAPAEPYDFRAIAVYGLVTLAVILGLWLTIHALGRHPILVRSAGAGLDPDWIAVTDNELRYSVGLPGDWSWLEVDRQGQDAILQELLNNQPYISRAQRYTRAFGGQPVITAVAIEAQSAREVEPRPFLVISQGGDAPAKDPQAILAALDDQPLPVTEARVDERFSSQPQARFNLLDETSGYQCRHLVVAGANDAAVAYLLAACAPQARFGAMQSDLAAILDSFQLLEN